MSMLILLKKESEYMRKCFSNYSMNPCVMAHDMDISKAHNLHFFKHGFNDGVIMCQEEINELKDKIREFIVEEGDK